MGKGLHDLFVADHFVHQRGLLGTRLGLLFEHREGAPRDEVRHEQRKRRQQHHNKCDAHIDRQHENQRAQNRDHAREQLGKAHQQAVGKLIDIRNDAADHLAVGVAVDVFQRQHLNLAESLIAHIADDLIGDLVVDDVHQPLRQRCDGHHNHHARQRGHHLIEVHLPRGHDEVDCVAHEDRDIKRQRHGNCRQQDRQHHKEAVARDALHDLFQRCLLRGGIELDLCLSHVTSPPSCHTESSRSPDRPYRFPAAPRVCRCRRPCRRPAQRSGRRGGWRRCAGRR